MSILVLNSDPELGKIVQERLSGHGYQVTLVSDPSLVMPIVSEKKFEAVLLDTDLPQASGLDLTHELREKYGHYAPEIILLSSGKGITVEEAHQAGACHVLSKPFNYNDLFTVLQRFTAAPEGQSRRRYERVNINPAVLGQLYGSVSMPKKNSPVFKAEVSNIGRGGFFFRDEGEDVALPEIGQIVHFELQLGMVPNYAIKGVGIIRWVDHEKNGAGVEFIAMPSDAENFVSSFVELFKVQSFVPNC